MSEPKGPFDAAFIEKIKKFNRPWNERVVEVLREEYLCTDKDGKPICLLEKCEDYQSCLGKPFISAIRVLEAAGKIKDPRATELAFLTIVDEARVDEKNQFVCEIRALLEVLSGKEEK